MKWWLPVGLVLLILSGCARCVDWIDCTQVTVVVAGRWTGKLPAGGTGSPGGELDMILEQTGPKATGDLKMIGPHSHLWSGPIEGNITGNVLKFWRTDGRLRGEMMVAEDDMSGTVTFSGATRTLRLQRHP